MPEVITDRSGWNDPTGYHQSVRIEEERYRVETGKLPPDYGRCLCGHLDEMHEGEDACTEFECECEAFETDGSDLNEWDEDDWD